MLSHFSHVQLFAVLWTVACQVPLSMGFSRQEYWSGLPFPSPGNLPDPGIKPMSPALQVNSLPLHHRETPGCVFVRQKCMSTTVCMLSRFSRVQLFAVLWTVACQAPLSMGLPRQEYGSGLPFPSPGDLPHPGIELVSPAFGRQILYHILLPL